MKSKLAKPAAEPMTIGTQMVAKYRPLASKLSKAERQRLLARGLQLVYADTPAAKPAHQR